MADYASGLPIRSEADGTDERVHVKIVDGVTPSQMATVDADKNVHVEVHGNDPAGADIAVRLSELGAVVPDGVYHATNNSDPGNVGLIGHTRAASPADTDQVQRLTAKQGTVDNTVHALDVSMHDEAGNPFSDTNPLPVTLADSEGDEVNDFKLASAIAAGATDNHDYTVTALKTLKLSQIEAAASGKMKMVVGIETGVATGIFTTKWTMFNSTANPNMHLPIKENPAVAAGVKVRVALTNLDNQSQDLYSTISGHEI